VASAALVRSESAADALFRNTHDIFIVMHYVAWPCRVFQTNLPVVEC